MYIAYLNEGHADGTRRDNNYTLLENKLHTLQASGHDVLFAGVLVRLTAARCWHDNRCVRRSLRSLQNSFPIAKIVDATTLQLFDIKYTNYIYVNFSNLFRICYIQLHEINGLRNFWWIRVVLHGLKHRSLQHLTDLTLNDCGENESADLQHKHNRQQDSELGKIHIIWYSIRIWLWMLSALRYWSALYSPGTLRTCRTRRPAAWWHRRPSGRRAPKWRFHLGKRWNHRT